MILVGFPLVTVPVVFAGGVPAPPPIAQPNGRWRAVPDAASPYFQNVRTDLSPILFEIGFTLFYCSPAVLLFSDETEMVFTKPSGSVLRVSFAVLSAIGNDVVGQEPIERAFIRYIFNTGDLDETGVWHVHLENNDKPIGGFGAFMVLPL